MRAMFGLYRGYIGIILGLYWNLIGVLYPSHLSPARSTFAEDFRPIVMAVRGLSFTWGVELHMGLPTLPRTNMETQKGLYKDYSPFKGGLYGFPSVAECIKNQDHFFPSALCF